MTQLCSSAREVFEKVNAVSLEDDIYRPVSEEHMEVLFRDRPWQKDLRYFKKVRISAVALLKMLIHTRSGGDIEVMGLMQGKVMGEVFYILDTFPLPVEGTETRVNAGAQANEFMVQYLDLCEHIDQPEQVVGWYHSHPGYGCWLSGIDVGTQQLYQQHQEPFLAIVIDPTRTAAVGQVEIGAFRTFPVGSESTEDIVKGHIPMEKVQDFGVHCR
jgi:COP9 signalosome complex subunit 5